VRTAGHSRMLCSQAAMKWLLSYARKKERIFNIYYFCFLLNLSSLYIYIFLNAKHIKQRERKEYLEKI
jgi:hypothetical protein